jgi:tetratricopeptide (TPR) repeat protein/predicted Ser/Thr protein kinase
LTDCIPSETLDRLHRGELGPCEAAAAGAHLRACAHCRSMLDQQTDHATLRGWLDAAPVPELDERVDPILSRLLDELVATAPGEEATPRETAAGPTSDASGPPAPAQDLGRLGPYRLLDELGRGGMGIVYRAWDEPLHRLVALKVLRPDQAEQADRQRLVREAQHASRFQNDHVVMIHAVVDPPDSLPFLVMEYVPGRTLGEFIASADRPEPRQVAIWVAEVALALHAAHAAGLIHRDVKPGNILIDERTRRAKITDFGLARAQSGQTRVTREGFIAGTPTSMSPEQARGDEDLDPRSDVYSLGSALYEALTGMSPYRGAPHLVLRQVIEEDPRPLRQLNDRIPRDLETICLKAMARERARRYQTARDLAEDLNRWLQGEPIHARPVGPFERAYRLARRNPRVAGLAAALVVVSTAGFLGVLWQWRRAEHNLKESEISFERARRAVDQFYTRFYREGVLAVPGLEKVRRDVLGEMIQYYKDFVDQHRNDPALRLELAEACLRIGDLTKDQGNKVDSLAVLRQAVQYFESLPPGAGDAQRVQMGLYRSLHFIALVESDLGDVESARRDYQRGFRILKVIVQNEPRNFELKRELAAVLGNFANLSLAVKDKAEARRAYLQALEIQKDLVDQDPSQVVFKNDLALTHHNLSFLADDKQECRALLERALTLRKQLVETLPGNSVFRRHLARTYERLALDQLSSGQIQDALVSQRESRTLLHQVVIEQPNVTTYQDNLAGVCGQLGSTLTSLGRHREAREAYNEARTMYQRLVQSNRENARYKESLLEVETILAEPAKASQPSPP